MDGGSGYLLCTDGRGWIVDLFVVAGDRIMKTGCEDLTVNCGSYIINNIWSWYLRDFFKTQIRN